MSGAGLRGDNRPIPQRLVIVVPTSGRFDSRAHRIASSVAERGHEVVIVGRWEPGLPRDEVTPRGYRILRVEVDPLAAIPGALTRRLVRGFIRKRQAPVAGSHSAENSGQERASRSEFPTGRVRGEVDAGLRLLRIALTVQAQATASRSFVPPADLYHGMGYLGLPVALDLGHRARRPVVYDARDIYVEARNLAKMPRPARTVFAAVERHWAHRAARVITVNEMYARELEVRLGVARPLVVMNCPATAEIRHAPSSRLRERLGLPPGARILLYHGGLTTERGIEQLLLAMPLVHPSAHLVLMGYGPLWDTLVARAKDPNLRGRVHVLEAVPPADLLEWVAGADVAVIPIQPTTLNHLLTTPNKLFEAMVAGVPVVAANLPGMASIVGETGCGVLCDPTDVADLARAINEVLTADASTVEGYRRRGRAAVLDRYNWERQFGRLLAEYERLTGRPW